jgi:hypothetical protein
MMQISKASIALPVVAPQRVSLEARINPRLAQLPQAPIRLRERVNLTVRELESRVAQIREGFEGPLDEPRTELLVRQNLSDDELNDFLGHDRHA